MNVRAVATSHQPPRDQREGGDDHEPTDDLPDVLTKPSGHPWRVEHDASGLGDRVCGNLYHAKTPLLDVQSCPEGTGL